MTKFQKILSTAALTLMFASANAGTVTLDILFDNFPNETGFGMWDAGDANIGGNVFAGYAYDVGASSPIGFGDGYALPGDFTGESPGPWQFVWNLGAGDYTFGITDTFGDGICCGWGVGSYTLTVNGGTVVGGGGAFGEFEATTFNVPEPGILSLFALGLLGVGISRRRRVAA